MLDLETLVSCRSVLRPRGFAFECNHATGEGWGLQKRADERQDDRRVRKQESRAERNCTDALPHDMQHCSRQRQRARCTCQQPYLHGSPGAEAFEVMGQELEISAGAL